MSKDTLKERIHDTNTTAWKSSHGGDAHLDFECRHRPRAAREIPLESFPIGYLSWCSRCLDRFKAEQGFHEFDRDKTSGGGEISRTEGSEQAAKEFLEQVRSD